MQQRDDFSFGKPFNDPQAGNNPTLSSQPPCRWSLTTLMAARPSPQQHTRAYAEEWNKRYHDIPQILVNPAEFPEKLSERSPEEIEENLQWLKDWANGIQRPNPQFFKS
jgi:hypothetical protein